MISVFFDATQSRKFFLDMKRIILFGDSITQQGFDTGGWAARLASRYVRRADVLNRGFSGYNTAWARLALDHVFEDFKGHVGEVKFLSGTLVTLFLGANDSALLGRTSETQHVPLPQFQDNLAYIIKYLKDRGAQVIALAPPPVAEGKWSAFLTKRAGAATSIASSRENATTGLYAAAVERVAQAHNIPVVNLWSLFQKDRAWENYLSDGLHLSESGNRLLYTLLAACIEESLPAWAVVNRDGVDTCGAGMSLADVTSPLPLLLPLHGTLNEETSEIPKWA
eukprot:m.127009 g.127009  ORF g.127009 m.127009 type:complete len:281 (+) comp17402_c0_seq5:133-975(+)